MVRSLTLFLFLTLTFQCVRGYHRFGLQDVQSMVTTESPCIKRDPDQEKLLQEAEKNGYTTGRTDFRGNVKTRDVVFRRAIWLNEGDQFTNQYLQRSLKSLSKLKIIYPVRSDNVKAIFDKE